MTYQSSKVVTEPVRLSYVHLLEPHAIDEDDKKKYSCVLLIPKTDTVTLDKINAAIEVAKDRDKGKHWGGKIPKVLQMTLRDGDEEKDTDEQPEYAGMMFMSVRSDRKPGLVNKALDPILDPDEVYSGMYARVAISAYGFSKPKNGITFGLENVMKTGDGESLGGGREKAEDAFSEFADEGGEGSLL